jgi:hypothetical protein
MGSLQLKRALDIKQRVTFTRNRSKSNSAWHFITCKVHSLKENVFKYGFEFADRLEFKGGSTQSPPA